MAIYHMSAKVISRSTGRSATAAAAYRSGSEIVDERTGLVHDYSRKDGVDEIAIIAPSNAPAWANDRSKLWNMVEHVEKRKDSQVAREMVVAIPKELKREQMVDLVKGFAKDQFVDRGMVADIAFHHLGTENPHAHIMLTTRSLSPEGFGNKAREWNDKAVLKQWRKEWELHANKALEVAGHESRIDHRSLEAQGIERAPTVHLGPTATAIERRGAESERGDTNRERQQLNAQIIDLAAARTRLERQRSAPSAAAADLPGLKKQWTTERAKRFDPIKAKAERIIAKAEKQKAAHGHKLQAHDRNRPAAPTGLFKGMKQATYEQAALAWDKTKKQLEKRWHQLRERIIRVAEYTKEGLDMYPSKGEQMADRKLAQERPELAKALEQAKAAELDQRREKTREQQTERQKQRQQKGLER